MRRVLGDQSPVNVTRHLAEVDFPARKTLEEFEKFFITTDQFEDKKLKIIGWEGPEVGLEIVKDAAKAFAKDQAG